MCSSPSPPAPATSMSQTTIPEYAQPYVERMLGKAEALTEAPYQAYGGERVAGFTPLQQQAFQGVSDLGPSRQIGLGTQMAGISGLQALGAGQNYQNMATDPYATGAYMSPYIENALQPQLREAARQSAIQGQMDQARAVQQNAYGGSRSAIVEAERQRNLGQLQSDIYGRGLQSAYQQAQQAQQFGSTLGLQGAQAAGQSAATLGQLGQTQFGQQKDVIAAQQAAGSQQQALQQQKLQQQYQDFLNQKGYNQQQLAFMSDILRGAPLGTQTQQQYTAAAPSFASQALGLGAAGVGAYMKASAAEGGQVHNGLERLALHNMVKDQS